MNDNVTKTNRSIFNYIIFTLFLSGIKASMFEMKSPFNDLNGYMSVDDVKVTGWCRTGEGYVKWADVTGDGKEDLICHKNLYRDTEEVDIIISTGTGCKFWNDEINGRAFQGVCTEGYPYYNTGLIYFYDFNIDNKVDFFCFLFNGSGGLYSHISLGTSFKSIDAGYPSYKFANTGNTNIWAFGDFNGDLFPDVFIWTKDNTRWIGLSKAGTSHVENSWIEVKLNDKDLKLWCNDATTNTMFYADFDGDSTYDLICSKDDGTHYILLSAKTNVVSVNASKDGKLTLDGTILTGFCPKTTGKVLWADFNGDGKVDVICTHSDGSYQVLVSTGNELKSPNDNANGFLKFNSVQLSNWCMSSTTGTEYYTWVDVNKDNKIDLACHGSNGSHWILLSDGSNLVSGTSNTHGQLCIGNQPITNWCLPSQALKPKWADFNGDGVLDIACHYKDGSHAVLVSNYTPPGSTSVTGTTSPPTVNSIKGTNTNTSTTVTNTNNTNTQVTTTPAPAPAPAPASTSSETAPDSTSTNQATTANISQNSTTTQGGTGGTQGHSLSLENSLNNTIVYNDTLTTQISNINNVTNIYNTINNGTATTTGSTGSGNMAVIVASTLSALTVAAALLTVLLKCKKLFCFKEKAGAGGAGGAGGAEGAGGTGDPTMKTVPITESKANNNPPAADRV